MTRQQRRQAEREAAKGRATATGERVVDKWVERVSGPNAAALRERSSDRFRAIKAKLVFCDDYDGERVLCGPFAPKPSR